MRRGTSAGRGAVVVKIAPIEGPRRLAGFAVSRAVGGAVTRNTVKRRLRAICTGVLPELPLGTGVLVRALPAAAGAPYSTLERDVRAAVEAAMKKRES